MSQNVALTQDLTQLSSVQRFATTLAEGDTPEAQDAALASMVDSFQNVVERYYPDVLAASFVTPSGSIWGRSEIWDDGSVGRSRDAVVDALANDPAAQAAFDAPAGQAVARAIELKSDPTTPEIDLGPYIRIFMPINIEGGSATNSGLVALDVRADALLDTLQQVQGANASVLGDTRTIILDNAGHVFFDSETPDLPELVMPNDLPSQTFPSINQVLGTQEALLLSPQGEDVLSTVSIRFPGRSDVYMRLIAVNDLELLQNAGHWPGFVRAGRRAGEWPAAQRHYLVADWPLHQAGAALHRRDRQRHTGFSGGRGGGRRR